MTERIKYFLLSIFLYTGLPLLAWGPESVREFFFNPFRTAYAVFMILATFLVVLFVPRKGRGEGGKTLPRQRWAVVYLQTASLIFVIVSPFADRHGWFTYAGGPFMRGAGLMLTFFGYFLMNWSLVVLCRQFGVEVTLQKDHTLVTQGPYHLIRHPRYLGILLFFAGLSLLFRSGLSMSLTVVTLFVIRWRIIEEEALLKSEFGERWDEYVKKTWRLVPFIF